MRNALHEPQTIVLLGGTSEIGRAIVDELLSPSASTLVLAVRRPDDAAPDQFARPGLDVVVEQFDATDADGHDAFARRLATEHGDIDVVIVAFGALGDHDDLVDDPAHAAVVATTNFTGVVTSMLAFANVLRRQGHGHLVLLSSVAGERVRAANFVYGSTKAGADAFAQGLGDSLAGTGVEVTVVRPGFVHSKMTQGMKSAPFATTPRVVAELTVAGMRKGRHTVWAPGVLRYVFSVLRHVPRPVFRRLPLG